MNMLESIVGAQGGAAVNQLAAQFGLNPDQAQTAIAALMPALAAGLQRNMSSEGGLTNLVSALGKGRHDTYLENPSALSQPTTVADGNAILGHVFGSKDVSRQVAANASQRTGIEPSILKKMLPLVAALAMGSLSKQTRTTGATAGGLTSMLGPLLDRDGDGSMLDDVAGMLGGILGGRKKG